MSPYIRYGIPAFLVAVAIFFALSYSKRASETAPAAISPPPALEEARFPVSVRELLHNLTDHSAAKDMPAATFKGYYNLDGFEPRRLAIERSAANLKVRMQGRADADREWELKDLRLFHFRNDPDSLVVILPDQRQIYLRYNPQMSLKAYPQNLRGWSGWMVTEKKPRQAAKIVLIEDVNPTWPRPESLMEAAPSSLPR